MSSAGRHHRLRFLSGTIGLVALILSLIGIEILLRLFQLAPAAGLGTVTQREFAAIPGICSPNQHFVDRRIPALAHQVTTALTSGDRAIESLYLLPHDGHPSPAGYQLAADAIADTIVAHARPSGGCRRADQNQGTNDHL